MSDFDDDTEGSWEDMVSSRPVRADQSLIDLLDRAWRRWFDVGPEPVALLGQMLDIARNTPEGRAGRPAAAVGVSAATWNKWLLGARGLKGGTRPSARSRERIGEAMRSTRVRPDYSTPTTVVVRAVIVWAGYQNGRRDPLGMGETPDMSKVRTTRLTDVNLGGSRASWEAYEKAASAQELLDALQETYGVPIELYEVDSLTLED